MSSSKGKDNVGSGTERNTTNQPYRPGNLFFGPSYTFGDNRRKEMDNYGKISDQWLASQKMK